MNKSEVAKKMNQNTFSLSSNNCTQKQNNKIKNIEDNSLYSISYSSPKKHNNNIKMINNYIIKNNQQINIDNNGNNEADQRLLFCLNMLGLTKYYPNFIEKNLNFQGLLALTNNDMIQMKIPAVGQKIIQNFILDYLYFGSQYSLDELKLFFSKRNSKNKNYKKSYSYDSYKQRIKKIKGINKNQLNENNINNNIIIGNNKNPINMINKGYQSDHQKVSLSYNNNLYSNNTNTNNTKTMTNINSLQKQKYIAGYNNKKNKANNSSQNNIHTKYNLYSIQNINRSEGNLIHPSLKKHKNKIIQPSGKKNTNFDLNNMKNSVNLNTPISQNSSKSSKELINKLYIVLMKNRERKQNKSLRINNSYDHYLKKKNKINFNNSYNNYEYNYSDHYSDNNINIKNDAYNYNNINNINNNFINNYEKNNFYTGKTSIINSSKKNRDENDSSTQIGLISPINSKLSKIKKFKDKQMEEVNQLLEYSSNKDKIYNINNNLNPYNEKRGMIMNNLNNYFIYNNFRTDFGNDLNKNIIIPSNDINSNENGSIIQKYQIKNKIKYYRNKDNLFYNDIYSIDNTNNNNNQNIIDSKNISKNITQHFKKNINKKHQFLGIPIKSSSLIKSGKNLENFDNNINEDRFDQYLIPKPKIISNNTKNNLYNKNKIKINNRNNYSFNNYISDFHLYYNNLTENNNNRYNFNNNLNNINTKINNINTNINDINVINKINNINSISNLNNINNMELFQLNNKNNIINQNNLNNTINNNIFTPFQQYNKSSQNFYRRNINFRQNTAPCYPRPIANYEMKNDKHNKIKNIPNQHKPKNVNIINKNNNGNTKINLYKNMSKNQLEKLKIGIKKRLKKTNYNNLSENKNNIKLKYPNTQYNFYNSNISNNNINNNINNLVNYQNNKINSNYFSNNYNINNINSIY